MARRRDAEKKRQTVSVIDRSVRERVESERAKKAKSDACSNVRQSRSPKLDTLHVCMQWSCMDGLKCDCVD